MIILIDNNPYLVDLIVKMQTEESKGQCLVFKVMSLEANNNKADPAVAGDYNFNLELNFKVY